MSEVFNIVSASPFKSWLQNLYVSLYSINAAQRFKEWKAWEKNVFRFFFIFFIILLLPIDWKFYRQFFAINWLHLHFHDLFQLSRYQTQFIPESQLPKWGLDSFANWGIAILISLAGVLIWRRLDRGRREYTVLYYWLRVILRYRLALVLITYGFIKLFPLQMPYPSLSNLLTNYGDFFPWKIYFQTLGISPKYESFLGFVEILCGFLLFNRKTVTIGVGIIFGFIGNVAVVNGFYDVGELLTSSLIVLMASFLFVYDIPRLHRMLIKEAPAYANKLIPRFSDRSLKNWRYALKGSFLLFVLIFAFKTYENFIHDPYKVPHTPGLAGAYGYYNVQQFVLNKDTIPYSKTDPNRWQDVVFEKWSTLTIKNNRPVQIDYSSGEVAAEKDIDRNYELAGFAGRHYYHYEADTVHHTLSLQNKNIHNRGEKLFLNYSRLNDSTLVLDGINERNDSIHVVLNQIHKKYMMFEGRRRPVKI